MTNTITIEVPICTNELADAIIDALVRKKGDDIDHNAIEAQIFDDFSSPMITTRVLYDTETLEILALNE